MYSFSPSSFTSPSSVSSSSTFSPSSSSSFSPSSRYSSTSSSIPFFHFSSFIPSSNFSSSPSSFSNPSYHSSSFSSSSTRFSAFSYSSPSISSFPTSSFHSSSSTSFSRSPTSFSSSSPSSSSSSFLTWRKPCWRLFSLFRRLSPSLSLRRIFSPFETFTPHAHPAPPPSPCPTPPATPHEGLTFAPCCACGRCKRCCSCCFCCDRRRQRARHAAWYTWFSRSVSGGPEGGGERCGRCGGGFSLFFNKRVVCGGPCQVTVCRRCAPWSPAAKAYVCGVCAAPPATPTTPVTPVTPSTPQGTHSKECKEVEAGVRSHIEALVEGQVGGPLDSVSASPTAAHPLQRGLFSTHHAALSTTIAKLSYSLQMSILNQPLPPEDLPTTRHTHLTDRVTQVLRDAMILPRQMESYDPAMSPETPVEDFNSHTYEDILATAILNKVLESCEGKRPDEVTIEVSHDVASTDTDSGMSGGAKESRRGRHKSEAGSEGSEERSLTPPARHTPAHRPPTASPDQGVVTDECWGPAYTAHDAPLQFKIEEHVEEVTTHHVTDEDEDEDEGDASDSGSWRGSRGSLEDRRRTRRHKKVTQHSVTQDPLVSCLPVALPDPTQVTSRRVSFPELGRDIIQDSCSDTECCTVSPSDMVVEADSWEENWLFRRQRLAGGKNSDPITMLIPNPEAHVTATVGNRDVDELSELSEQRSVCSSEPWSDSDGEGEGLYSGSPNAASRELSLLAGEIVAEFGQQDHEYTVDYSAASRMAARRTPPPHSPSYSKPSRPHSLLQHTRHPMEPSREYHNGRPARGTPRDSESVSDNERPVPKPRKLSLATTPSSKASDKSPGKPFLSPMEDLTILSPPLNVPLPSEAKSSSETVWFVETPQDCVVLQGRTLRLSCVLNTKRPMGLTWYHNGSLVQSGGQEVWAWRRGPTHHLHLYNMTPAAAGVYAAAAYTASHCVWAFCRVHYKASARPAKQPTFTKGLTNAAVEECGELTLQCQVQGHPEPRVTFSRGTQQLQPSSRLAIESDQYGTWTLRLSDCALVDAGEVTATANNTLASATCRCQVKVFPEGTPLPCQDASRSSRQQKSQNNQQLKGRSGSKLTQKTSHPGPHLSDNTARTPSTAALITPSHLQLEDSLTTSSDAKRGGREQEDIQQVPTKPGTASGKPEDLSGALEELHDTTLEETQRSPLLLLSNTASASEASVHEELDAIAGDVGGGGSGVGAAAVSVRHSGQGSNKHLHNFSAIAEETSDLAACVGESFPSAPVHGASLDLDYYPSSHDDHTSSSSDTDNNEDGKELTLMRPTDYLHSTSSTHQTSQTNPPALPSSLPPNQLHASSSLEDPCLQKHEGCLRDSPSSASPSGAPQSVTGTIAEREHRKWEAAVPLPNNPYSPERLAHRLSHSRPPDHAIYTRSSSVEVDLDPSLQDGLPCRADLNRYSRDYYVAGSTNGTAAARSRSNFVNHQKHGQENYQTPKPQPLTNGCHTPPNTSQQVTRNGQDIRIALGGNQNSTTSKIQNLRDIQGKSEVEGGSFEVVGSCKAVDWKDELKDIQAARVEQEVARLQRTIDEKQRRWEIYARHAPGRGISTLSDGSTEHLHHPHSEAYLVPPRHDLWRTVSEDTISVPLREVAPQQPLLRHTSMDSLRPTTKVSNIQSLAHQPQQSTTSINSVGSSSIDGQPPNHSTLSHLGRSLDSVGGDSDREVMDSDGSHHTPDSPALPSVKKLASRFDTGSQKVNNLDKLGKNNSHSHSGKNIHSIGRVPQTDRATYTNNFNKRNEKPYVMKEVHSLTARSMPLRIREGLRAGPACVTLQGQSSPSRDAPSPEHLGIPWGPAAIPARPTQIPGDTSDDSSAPSGSPRRVPRRRSGGRREHPGWCARPECGSLTDPALQVATDSYC